jgi:periplasmic protein TonB
MFETVVPEIVARRSRRVFYETLPVSLAVHAVAVVGILTASAWEVAFPIESPRMTLAYSLTRIPDPPPPPPPPPARQPAAPEPAKPQLLPKALPPPAATEIVAPTVIPDFIPQLAAAEPSPMPLPVVEAPAIIEKAPHGVEGGDPKGLPGGDLLGKKFGVAGGIAFAEDGKVHVDRAVKLPLQVLEQEFPRYPEAARKERLEDKCVIRYTVGLNGRVADIAVIERAQHEMFENASLDVIRRWRFRPMKVNGKAVEVVHEVEFFYQFTQR